MEKENNWLIQSYSCLNTLLSYLKIKHRYYLWNLVGTYSSPILVVSELPFEVLLAKKKQMICMTL